MARENSKQKIREINLPDFTVGITALYMFHSYYKPNKSSKRLGTTMITEFPSIVNNHTCGRN